MALTLRDALLLTDMDSGNADMTAAQYIRLGTVGRRRVDQLMDELGRAQEAERNGVAQRLRGVLSAAPIAGFGRETVVDAFDIRRETVGEGHMVLTVNNLPAGESGEFVLTVLLKSGRLLTVTQPQTGGNSQVIDLRFPPNDPPVNASVVLSRRGMALASSIVSLHARAHESR